MTEPREEQVRAESRRHGIVLVPALLRAAALAAGGGALVVLGWPVSVAGGVALALGALTGLRAAWRWERTLVVLTTARLVVVHGTVRRRTAAVPLGGAVEVEQSLLGRLLGYGTIVAGELEVTHVPRDLVRLVA